MVGKCLVMTKGRTKPFQPLFIQERRESLGMTQEELAEIMGVDAMSISRWERGTRFPRGRRLPLLAQTLKCSVSDLYREPSDLVSLDSMLVDTPKPLRKQIEAVIKAMKEGAEKK